MEAALAARLTGHFARGLLTLKREKGNPVHEGVVAPVHFALWPDGKRGKTGTVCCPAQKAAHIDGGTSDLALDCGGAFSSTEPSVYLGPPPYYNHIMN